MDQPGEAVLLFEVYNSTEILNLFRRHTVSNNNNWYDDHEHGHYE